MMMIGYQTHDENIREAELEASSCARERGSPVLALQDVGVKPVDDCGVDHDDDDDHDDGDDDHDDGPLGC